MRLQKGVVRARHKKLIGSLGRVLVEGHSEEHGGVPVGRTSAMAPEVDGLVILDACDTPPGHFVNVRITHAAGYDLVATPTMF
jgi:ribosomal protein S12 methylthiotransferase